MIMQLIFAAQTFVFPLACDVKVDEDILEAAIQVHLPDVKVRYDYCRSALAINGVIQPNTKRPAEITVSGVPDGITKQRIKDFLIAHNPTEDKLDKERRRGIEARNEQLKQMPVIQQMLADIAQLKGTP